jgi:hypothetical protein
MPDSIHALREMLNQDVQLPFMLGMVTKVKTFVIDKPMIALITLLVVGSSSTGVFIYQLSEARATITTMGLLVEQLTRDNNRLILEVSYMRRDLDKIATSLDKHLIGHPVTIAK